MSQTIYPSRFPTRSPYYIVAVVHAPGVGVETDGYDPELDAEPVYLYANVEVNQDVPADQGTDFVYLYANIGIDRPEASDTSGMLYLYVNPVAFVQMPIIFAISSAQPLAPGSDMSGWGILPIAL